MYVAVKGQQMDLEGAGQSRGGKGSGDDEGGKAGKDQPLAIMTMGARCGAWATAKLSQSRSGLVQSYRSFSLQMVETYWSSNPGSLLCIVSTCK